jgi:hypothetical protein
MLLAHGFSVSSETIRRDLRDMDRPSPGADVEVRTQISPQNTDIALRKHPGSSVSPISVNYATNGAA